MAGMRRIFPLLALTTWTALLAACGGGGGDAAPAAAGSSAPTSPAPTATVSTCGLPDFQAELLQRVNAARAAGASCGARGSFPAAPALAWHDALAAAASAHSNDMVTKNFFSHTGSSGSSAGDRLTAAGYPWRAYGENIAAGYGTVQRVVDGWMASEGHCANIMNASLREIGVACVPGTAGTTYGDYWTMDLGLR